MTDTLNAANLGTRMDAEVKRVIELSRNGMQCEDIMIKALNKLACLGNGDKLGNSDGNIIAQDALRAVYKLKEEVKEKK